MIVSNPTLYSFLATLGGGLLFCVGVRAERFVVRLVGLILQCVGLYLFLDNVWYPFRSSMLLNSYFLGSCIISFSAFFSVFFLETSSVDISKRDNWSIFLLLFLGMSIWYTGGIREIYMHICTPERLNGVLLFTAATSIVAGLIGEKIHWEKIHYFLLLQLPITLCVLIYALISGGADSPLLAGWGSTVWAVTFFVQYRILAVLDGLNWPKGRVFYHLFSLWMVLFVSSREFFLQVLPLQTVSVFLVAAIAVCSVFAWACVIRFMARKGYWPVEEFSTLYLWVGGSSIAIFCLGWSI